MKIEKSYATQCLDLERELNRNTMIIGINCFIEVHAITQWKTWFRFHRFEMDADARQSLKCFTMQYNRPYGYSYSHCIWYEDWI